MFPLVAIISLMDGLISSVPVAIELWNKLQPFLPREVEVPQVIADEIKALTGPAHEAVDLAHRAIGTIMETHTQLKSV